MKTIFKHSIINNVGEVVLAIDGYKDDNGNYGYAVYPVIGAIDTERDMGTRIMIIHPIISRSMPSSNDGEFIDMLMDRCDRSNAIKVEGSSMNIIVWNGKHVGYLCDSAKSDQKTVPEICITYDGETNIHYTVVTGIIDSLEFDELMNSNLTKESDIKVALIPASDTSDRIRCDWLEWRKGKKITGRV